MVAAYSSTPPAPTLRHLPSCRGLHSLRCLHEGSNASGRGGRRGRHRAPGHGPGDLIVDHPKAPPSPAPHPGRVHRENDATSSSSSRAAPFDAAPFDAAPFDAAPFDAATFDAAPFDAAADDDDATDDNGASAVDARSAHRPSALAAACARGRFNARAGRGRTRPPWPIRRQPRRRSRRPRRRPHARQPRRRQEGHAIPRRRPR